MRPSAASRPTTFWTDPQIIDDFKATVHYLLTRKNTYTGVAYRDEPAIFGWETGNEILPTPEWTREIAAYIKQLDKNHLVIDGKSLRGVPTESLDDPNIDVITTHHYPFGDDHDFAKPIRAAHALAKGKKAYFVGEFGFVEMPHIANAIQTAIDDGTSGALLWSLRMHRREGGFYWHMEVGTGRNIYKAFHWPGFASGDRYDERAVMKLVRDKAYEIRGLQPPPLERPAPPKLLPIEKVSAISWQGSAGASAYDVWRAAGRGRTVEQDRERCFRCRRSISAAVQRRLGHPGPAILVSHRRPQFGGRFGAVEYGRPGCCRIAHARR